jgi:hypothetical protein
MEGERPPFSVEVVGGSTHGVSASNRRATAAPGPNTATAAAIANLIYELGVRRIYEREVDRMLSVGLLSFVAAASLAVPHTTTHDPHRASSVLDDSKPTIVPLALPSATSASIKVVTSVRMQAGVVPVHTTADTDEKTGAAGEDCLYCPLASGPLGLAPRGPAPLHLHLLLPTCVMDLRRLNGLHVWDMRVGKCTEGGRGGKGVTYRTTLSLYNRFWCVIPRFRCFEPCIMVLHSGGSYERSHPCTGIGSLNQCR